MQPEAFCAVGCPPQKLCPVADDNFGCVIGTERLHNPGQPRCCEVDNADVYLSTVRDILAYLNTDPNNTEETAGFRRVLSTMLQRLNVGAGAASMFSEDTLFIDNSSRGGPNANFTPSQTDDFLKLLEKAEEMPTVELYHDDITRQPIARRTHNFLFYIFDPPPNAPSNLLGLASHVSVFLHNVNPQPHEMVSLAVHVLGEEVPTFAECRHYISGSPASPLSRGHYRTIRRAMLTSNFTGAIRLDGNNQNLLADDVPIGTDEWDFQRKRIITTATSLEIYIDPNPN